MAANVYRRRRRRHSRSILFLGRNKKKTAKMSAHNYIFNEINEHLEHASAQIS